VTSVSIDQSDLSLAVGETAALTTTVVVVGGASQDVEWSSSDDAVATVSAAGVVTAVAVGTADITATSSVDGTKSDSVTVTVTAASGVTSISDLTAEIALGSTVELAWEAENASSIEVVCFDGVSEQAIETLVGTAESTSIAIPASDCQTVRVYARGVGNDDDVETVLTGVVLNGADAGAGSLRSVFAAAAPGDIIGFAADVDVVTLVSKQLVSGVDAHMFLNKDITISGPATRVVIQSDPTLPADPSGVAVLRTRVFNVTVGANVRLDGVEVTGGTFIGFGAGIRNAGDLHLSNAVVRDNRAFYFGGGISNLGTLLVEGSELRDNGAYVTEDELTVPFLCVDDPDRTCTVGDSNYIEAPTAGGSGGALYNGGGTVTIRESVIADNRAAFSGGGIYNDDGGSVTVEDSDIQGNAATAAGLTYATTSYGGGVQNLDTFSMAGGEVSGNASEQDGGGLSNGSYGDLDKPMQLTDVTVTGNTAGQYGGGAVNYHSLVGGTGNLVVTGGSITGNTAVNAGPNRYDILIDPAPTALGLESLAPSTFEVPDAYQRR